MSNIIDLDIEQLKADLLNEVAIHQNIGTDGQKPCNRGSCHLNIVFHKAAMRQKKEEIKVKEDA